MWRVAANALCDLGTTATHKLVTTGNQHASPDKNSQVGVHPRQGGE